MARFKLGPDILPTLTVAQSERLDTLTDAQITLVAETDADNLSPTIEELTRMQRNARLGDCKTKFIGTLLSFQSFLAEFSNHSAVSQMASPAYRPSIKSALRVQEQNNG